MENNKKILLILEVMVLLGSLFVIFDRDFMIDEINIILFLGLLYSTREILKSISSK